MRYHCDYQESYFEFHDATLLRSYWDDADWIMEFANVCVEAACPENHYLYAMQTPLLYMRFENSVMIGGVSYGYTYTTEAGKRKQIPDYPFQKRDIQDVTELLCTRTNFWVTDGADVSTDTETIFRLDLDLQADVQGRYTNFVGVKIKSTKITLEWDTYRGIAWYEPRRRK